MTCDVKGKDGALLYIPVWFTLLVAPTGKLLFFLLLSLLMSLISGQVKASSANTMTTVKSQVTRFLKVVFTPSFEVSSSGNT